MRQRTVSYFDEILEKTQIPRAAGGTVFTAEEAKEVANRLGYPVLVRPSYVLGGQGMKIAFNDDEIEEFIGIINRIAQDHPILVDKYLQGKEIEVDAVCDGTDILIPGIMEHIERTGVHSGDSISVYPAPTISEPCQRDDRGIHKTSGTGTTCYWTDQHPVHRYGRAGIRDRGKPTFFQNRAIYQQSNRYSDR